MTRGKKSRIWYERGVKRAAASADRNPTGEDREDGLRAEHESAAAKPDAQKGSA